ncbi:unnamed protein product, partial [marine sediment metagenome]
MVKKKENLLVLGMFCLIIAFVVEIIAIPIKSKIITSRSIFAFPNIST